jgi:hypothetical protein
MDDPARLGDAHDAEPERHHSHQPDRQLDRGPGLLQHPVAELGQSAGGGGKQQANRHQRQPDDVHAVES